MASALPLPVHFHHVIGPKRIDPVQALVAFASIVPAAAWSRTAGVGSSRNQAPPAQRCGSSLPQRSCRGMSPRRQVGLDPGVGVGLPHLVKLAQLFHSSHLYPSDHAAGSPGCGASSASAVAKYSQCPRGLFDDEILDRVQVDMCGLPLQRILKLVRIGLNCISSTRARLKRSARAAFV